MVTAIASLASIPASASATTPEPAPGGGNIQLDAGMAATTLYGRDTSLSLHASNPSEADAYNLTFAVTLPSGVSYVGGSTEMDGQGVSEPGQYVGDDGTTVLIWTNVSDLLAGAASSMSLDVRANTDVYDVGDAIAVDASGYVNGNARTVPDVDPTTGASTSDATDADSDTATTQLSPFDVRVSEPNAERELLRGAHDHQTVYTVTIENNLVHPTTDFSIVTHVPAGLEFLGCGGIDNTTDSSVEYPGAMTLDGGAPALTNPCVTPASVATISIGEQGEPSLAPGVYTRVVWDQAALSEAFGSANLGAGETIRLDYVAAVGLRSNVDDGVATSTANLINNTGTLTFDEQALTTHVSASGSYAGITPSTGEGTEVAVAEDVSVHTSVSTGQIHQGGLSTWTMLIESSEYTTSTGELVVTETVPDGLDVIGSSRSYDVGFPVANPDGTTTLQWTLDGFTAPNGVSTISFDTVARTDYRATGLAVMTLDSWRSVTSLTANAAVMVGDGSTITVPVTDRSGASQTAGGIAITKSVAPPAADGFCHNGDGLTFEADAAGPFRPGDRVCWRLSVEFPDHLDTRAVLIQDHLPSGFRYEGHTSTPSDTVGWSVGLSGELPVLEWDLGDVDAGGQRFDVVIETTIDNPAVAEPEDLTANLLKVRYRNTANTVYQLRDSADAMWAEAVIDLDLAVVAIDDVTVPGGAADAVAVKANEVVTFRARIDNTLGTTPANDIAVRAMLPNGITCEAVSAISHDGECPSDSAWIEWTSTADLDLAGGDVLDLSYDAMVPAGITADVTMDADAGVRTYIGHTNTGTPFVYVPANNIDATLTPNTTPARDTTSVHTPKPTLDIHRITAITESGNSASNQATIGESIDYTIDVVLPAGTTFYGPGAISDSLGNRLNLNEDSVRATLDGNALGSGWTLTTVDNMVVLTFADDHMVPADADQIIEIRFNAVVTDVGANARPAKLRNKVKLEWDDHLANSKAQSDSVNTQIVEPNLSIVKASNDDDDSLEPAQIVTYTVTVSNPATRQVSTAHDIVVTDTVPAELTVLTETGEPANTGDIVGPNNGLYDAANRTIMWSLDSIDRGGSAVVRYDAQVASPLVASTVVSNAVAATATSMAGEADGERTAYSPYGQPGSGYRVHTVHEMFAPMVTLSMLASTEAATVGEPIDHTIIVTIPANTIAYDVVAMDDLPSGLDFDAVLSVTCMSGANTCEPEMGAATLLDGGHDIALFLGDAEEPSSQDRTITIVTRSIARDHYSVFRGGDLPTTGLVRHNATNRIRGVLGGYPWTSTFDHTSPSASVSVAVVEPSISLDKSVNGQLGDLDTRRAVAGETLTYSIIVENDSGSTVSSAHDLVVTSAVDERLVLFSDRTNVAGITAVDSDPTDGFLSWTVDGPLAPGEFVTITYEMTVPADWDSAQEIPVAAEVITNADVEHYYGVDRLERTAHSDRSFRRYVNVISDTVRVELDLASIGDRLWIDVDRDEVQDLDETGVVGVEVTAIYHGADGVYGTADDESYVTVTTDDGVWTVSSLPGGRYTLLVDLDDLPSGMTPTFDLDDGADPAIAWSGWLTQNQDRTDIDAGYADPPANTGFGYEEGSPVSDSLGNIWVVGTKPDGRAFVRTRTPEGVWSSWIQQGTGGWASMTINTDRAGNLWIVGVKTSGAAYVRTKDTTLAEREGWSQWVQQGSGGWASMSLATTPSGTVWLTGVKTSGTAYVRSKAADTQVKQGWSSWIHQGSKEWASVALATDSSGNVWLSGVTTNGKAYVRTKQAGGKITDSWSWWKRQSGSADWVSMNLSTDSHDNLWLVGVKESGTALVRQKSFDESIHVGWSSWHQLGATASWASMTLTVDDADALWVAGVKHSGTGYTAVKCYCPGISEGWSVWWQQGSVNTWHSLTISTDPANRVILTGLKLNGMGYVRIKGVDSGVDTAWSNWTQHGKVNSWDSFEPHSNAWTGIQPARTPSLGIQDIEWINPLGWSEASTWTNQFGRFYWWC